jgi:DNA repair protein RadC
MNLQYISDNKGNTTGVFIPIQDWEELKKRYDQLKKEESQMFEVPEWHKDIVRKRLEDYKKNLGNVMDWDEVQDNFKLD